MVGESRYVLLPLSFIAKPSPGIWGQGLMGSRDVYAQLTTAPMLKPLDWTRSRVRREHLISMGVPVNLDEVGFLYPEYLI
jgi:hypothetical protein